MRREVPTSSRRRSVQSFEASLSLSRENFTCLRSRLRLYCVPISVRILEVSLCMFQGNVEAQKQRSHACGRAYGCMAYQSLALVHVKSQSPGDRVRVTNRVLAGPLSCGACMRTPRSCIRSGSTDRAYKRAAAICMASRSAVASEVRSRLL